MRALVVARQALLRETEELANCSDEPEILASADDAICGAQLALIDNALRIHIGIALAFGYDQNALAALGVNDDMLHVLGIWEYTQTKMDSPPGA